MPWCSWYHASIIWNVCCVCLSVSRGLPHNPRLDMQALIRRESHVEMSVSNLLFEWLLGSENKLLVTLHSDSIANVSPSAGHLTLNSWKTLFHVSILCILLAVGASTPSSSSPGSFAKLKIEECGVSMCIPFVWFLRGRTGSWNVNDVGCGYYIDSLSRQGTYLCIGQKLNSNCFPHSLFSTERA